MCVLSGIVHITSKTLCLFLTRTTKYLVVVLLLVRWCSLFNADLALSVTMTAISTILSTIMLPVNLVLYATTSYSNDVVKALNWRALFVSLIVVIGAITGGLICSATVRSRKFNLMANKVSPLSEKYLVHDRSLLSILLLLGWQCGGDCLGYLQSGRVEFRTRC